MYVRVFLFALKFIFLGNKIRVYNYNCKREREKKWKFKLEIEEEEEDLINHFNSAQVRVLVLEER